MLGIGIVVVISNNGKMYANAGIIHSNFKGGIAATMSQRKEENLGKDFNQTAQ